MYGYTYNKNSVLEKFDSEPTAYSHNLVTSGNIQKYVDAADNLVDAKVDGMITRVANPFTFKGTVTTLSNLPSSGNTVNDTYFVTDEGFMYTWNGTSFDKTSTDVNNQLARDIATPYDGTKADYKAGDIVLENNQTYVRKQDATSAEGTFVSANWKSISLGDHTRMLQQDIETIIADLFDSTQSYNKGDYVIYQDSFYRAKNNISSDTAWTVTNWEEVTVSSEFHVRDDAITDLKSALNYEYKQTGVLLPSGAYANGTTLFTASDVAPGTQIFYKFNVTTGKAGYLEFFDSNDQRIIFIGKGSSASGALNYEGSYILPFEYSYVKSSGNDSIFIDYIKTSLSNVELFKTINDVTGLIYTGKPHDAEILFTDNEVSIGDILYVNFTANSNTATYIELLDENDTRLTIFGKISSSNGVLQNVGIIVVPTGFKHAVMQGNATIHYIQTKFPTDFITELQNQLLGSSRNLLDGVTYQHKRAVRVLNGTIETLDTLPLNVSGYISVIPKSKISVDFYIESTSFGFGFYDKSLNYVNGICSASNNTEFYVPDNAYFVVATLNNATIAGNPHMYITLPGNSITDRTIAANNPYERYALHEFGTLLNGYPHVAFPRMCFFNGKEIVVYRTGYQHMPTVDGTLLGDLQMDMRSPNGTWKHIKTFNASDFTGVIGDTRDFYIQPTRAGNYLLMIGGFTHYTDETPYYDFVIALLDTNLDIVDYKTFFNSSDYPYGNPLVTPEGHIIFTSFNNTLDGANVYRSNDPFVDTVSDLTFTKTTVYSNTNHSECCLGYFNDKLVLVVRGELLNNAKILYTSDLEGVNDWSNPSSLHISIHSPLLLPYYKGKYLPVVGSRCFDTSPQDRLPYLYYLDVENATPVAYGCIDDSLIKAYNGYPSFVPFGGEEYDVVYYQECPGGTRTLPKNTATGIYFKRINAREIIPSLMYLDI